MNLPKTTSTINREDDEKQVKKKIKCLTKHQIKIKKMERKKKKKAKKTRRKANTAEI